MRKSTKLSLRAPVSGLCLVWLSFVNACGGRLNSNGAPDDGTTSPMQMATADSGPPATCAAGDVPPCLSVMEAACPFDSVHCTKNTVSGPDGTVTYECSQSGVVRMFDSRGGYTTVAWRDASAGVGVDNECWSTHMMGGGTWIEHNVGWLGAYNAATNHLECSPTPGQSEWSGTLGPGCVERFFPTTSRCIGDGPPVCGRPSY